MPRHVEQPIASPARSWLPAFAIGAGALLIGWWATWFLCDDAFIAFRYAGNAYDGHGLVWNPAPFEPVEGYSCFLWVVLLWLVWSVTGLLPPDTANWLALGFALATLWTVARFLAVRVASAANVLALAGIGGSATFATWASSGLETAMFGFLAVAWTLRVVAGGGLFGLAAFAALAALTRPDGGLLVVATLAVAAHRLVVRRTGLSRILRGLLPLLLPLAHVLWRRGYYGEWLPNTYYAKVVAAWPESGLRYLYGFVLEHALWLLLPVALVALVRGTARGGALVAWLTWLFFVGYYALVVGGDHFGWRPFAHLIPLAFLAMAAITAAWRSRWLGPALLASLGVLGNTFGWCHERALAGREKDGFVRADAIVGPWLAPLLAGRDRDRAWLRLHYVALPRALHAETCADLLALLPERRPGQVEGLDGRRGVYRTVAAGVVGWALPDVAIVDAVGLNDWVVARHPARPEPIALDPAAVEGAFALFDADRSGRLDAAEIGAFAERLELSRATGVVVSRACWVDLLLALGDDDGDGGLGAREFGAAVEELRDPRHMAHERMPPPGYVEALRPNVVLEGGRFVAVEGVEPLTDPEVVAVEREFRRRVGR